MGYIREPEDVKYLILYCLSLLPMTVSVDDLMEVTMIDGGFGYFEFMQCFHELLESGHISELDMIDHKEYLLSNEGRKVVELMEGQLRLSVRDRAQTAALRVISRIRRNNSLRAYHKKNDDGSFHVTLAVYDKSFEMMSINVAVFNERQCQMLEQNFKDNAESIYKGLLSLLLEDPKAKASQEETK
jgi:hypothetical protein